MPPKPEVNKQPNTKKQQISDQAMQGVRAQTTLLDKINYLVNYQTYASMTKFLYNGRKAPTLWDKNDDPITDPVLIEQQRENNPDAYFSLDEQSRLIPNSDRETVLATDGAVDDIVNHIKPRLGPFDNVESEKQSFQVLGMIMAQHHLQRGKKYLENLAKLPPDEENREMKAEYLTNCDLGEHIHIDQAYVDTLDTLMSSTVSGYVFKRQNTVFKDAKSLKNVTLAQFADMSMMTPEEKSAFFAEAKEIGQHFSPDTNVYDYYRVIALNNEQLKKENAAKMGETYEIKEPDETTVCTNAFKAFYNDFQNACMHTGEELIRSNLSPEDRKALDAGSKLERTQTYGPPKPIRQWVKEKGHKMTYANRVDFLNNNYESVKQKANDPAPLNVKQNSVLANSFPKSTDGMSSYQKYMSKHYGGNILPKPLAEKKDHLAKFMAASILEAGGKPFSVKKINSMAETIVKMDEFRKLNEREVDRGLFNTKGALNLQSNIVRRTYSVPRDRVESYINDMKKLSKNMAPKGSQSDEYKAMHNSVNAIASLDPKDPAIDIKLVQYNARIFENIAGYSKGKKSVRTFEEGRSRFDNSMDALSIVKDNVPGLSKAADELVAKTNKVRDVKSGDENFVDLRNFGAKRAEESKAKNAAQEPPKKESQGPALQH